MPKPKLTLASATQTISFNCGCFARFRSGEFSVPELVVTCNHHNRKTVVKIASELIVAYAAVACQKSDELLLAKGEKKT